MKRGITIFLMMLIASSSLIAQEDFNRWSIDFGAGVNKATEPYASGFDQNQITDLTFELGARYMFNDKFGLRAEVGYSEIQPSSGSFDFDSSFLRLGVSGVANLGAVLGFRDWTNRFNLLTHAGVQYGRLDTEFNSDTDQKIGISGGLTPQLKLSNSIALNLNVTAFAFESDDLTWDGSTGATDRGFDSFMYTATIGASFYLGNSDNPSADWVDASDKKELQEEIDGLQNRLTTLEEDLKDDDKDGIPNYLDTEPNTPSGVMVDAKGRSIDENNNGVPDEMEAPLSNMFVRVDGSNNEEYQKSSGSDERLIKRLINEGYINVYFDFDSVQPSVSSYDAVHFIRNYMLVNTDVNAELVGYADELGDDGYNQSLSEQRAKRVYDILVSSGISETRLDFKGSGVDNSVDKNSTSARKVVRKVTFKIK
ncbi:OmpA family protein [Psychroflexus maritimus]|uniref:OmpA family protein n=1 Tax=Psychroflexus maritimus TaxID=2714865 RepID=A0A967AGF8_9FLAO|nr:OmpA family protein [Psychroflexus maritimus]NGZ90046.1 OmpA family protein [Psychroflexus maritimus]